MVAVEAVDGHRERIDRSAMVLRHGGSNDDGDESRRVFPAGYHLCEPGGAGVVEPVDAAFLGRGNDESPNVFDGFVCRHRLDLYRHERDAGGG